MNLAIIVGRLTKEPELRTTGSGTAVCSFSLAVDRRLKNQAGEKVTDFFTCVAWKSLGENCAKYLDKGSKVAVTGEIQNRSYETKDGSKRTLTEIICGNVEFLEPRKDAHGTAAPASGFTDIEPDGDLPF